MNLEIFKNEDFEIRGGLINDEPYKVQTVLGAKIVEAFKK